MNTRMKHQTVLTPFGGSQRFYTLCRSGQDSTPATPIIPCPIEPITAQHVTVLDAIVDWQRHHPEIPAEDLWVVRVGYELENKMLGSVDYVAAMAAIRQGKAG